MQRVTSVSGTKAYHFAPQPRGLGAARLGHEPLSEPPLVVQVESNDAETAASMIPSPAKPPPQPPVSRSTTRPPVPPHRSLSRAALRVKGASAASCAPSAGAEPGAKTHGHSSAINSEIPLPPPLLGFSGSVAWSVRKGRSRTVDTSRVHHLDKQTAGGSGARDADGHAPWLIGRYLHGIDNRQQKSATPIQTKTDALSAMSALTSPSEMDASGRLAFRERQGNDAGCACAACS